MKGKKYIMIGTPIITKEVFRNVLRPLNNYGFKPSGGFWASEYISNMYNISDWFTYLQDAQSIARYKNLNQSTIFTLKEEAKILTIDTTEQVIQLAKKYPSYHHILGHYQTITNSNTIFDYEKLSQDYDGIYINFNSFNMTFESRVFDSFSVNTLLLFNLNCIKEYQTAPIIYDIDNHHSIPYIKKENIGIKTTIEEESHEHQTLSNFTKELFLEKASKFQNYLFNDYNEYLQSMTQIVKCLIPEITLDKIKITEEITKYLKSKNMYIKQEQLVQNIVLNCLSEYLSQDEQRIKTLSKSQIKTAKTYRIY